MHTGGLSIPARMKELLAQPGFIGTDNGGQELRSLYTRGTLDLDPRLLSPFAHTVFVGAREDVEEAYKRSKPDLTATETPYKLSYAVLAIFGVQAVQGPPGSQDYVGTLQFLISKGMPVDIPDVVGFTALDHACMALRPLDALVKCLLVNGADPDTKDRYGTTAICGAMQHSHVGVVDALMEYGASIDVKDADGVSVRDWYVTCGPQVAAVISKWIRTRSGEAAPREEKRCDWCNKAGVPLKNCGKCRVARYCSPECQKKAWSKHKKTCTPFGGDNTVALKPFYRNNAVSIPTAEVRRNMAFAAFTDSDLPSPRAGSSKKGPSQSLTIKVQVPFTGYPIVKSSGDLMVYNKTRDFMCSIRRVDAPEAYERISEVVRDKGVGGAKAYFMAELESKDRLVVKVSELLAPQSW
ncbi:hypothetical protein MKEN_01487100 [Mycena kentingensis (nom. inval.)]|nr:hypothetical protein MKEN_01487100 [Mycena kentingensis (nom. inval.)]